ncbi:hypothetical protein AMELA_G00089330 [Ameiurus melas]|uniref:SAM domain-containing protein n=1 Tax=Ameiurus melas TaxID=219545 RepID=A0A7J6AZ73_AMEME|nr:hypothetical protein AMELA_G00089330 [Ameiurus melas]
MAETRAVEEVQNNRREISHSTELPAEIKDWDKEHVRDWILTLTDVDNENAKILYEQDINGPSLLLLEISEIKDIGIKLGPAKLIIHHRDELKANQLKNSGGNEDKLQLEETFYKGGKVSWWNFFFSEQPGSMPFIKRDKFEYIIDTIIPDMCSLRQACVRFNIFHIPGCGGTTLAMHVLWTLKEKFRCAILKNKDVDYEDVAKQVVNLLTYETVEQQPRLSVLLLIDDFEDSDAVSNIQQHIEKECQKKNVSAKSPQVILLNCMRADSWEQTEATYDTVFIGNKLSDKEQILFEKKLEEIEKIYQKNAETFYGFMILKKDFAPEYIQGVVKNTLKGFNFKKKDAQLIAVLVLLNCYCKSAKMSVSICEEFLGLPTRPDSTSCKVEDGFGKFSTLVTRCTAESSVEFQAIRVIHSRKGKTDAGHSQYVGEKTLLT